MDLRASGSARAVHNHALRARFAVKKGCCSLAGRAADGVGAIPHALIVEEAISLGGAVRLGTVGLAGGGSARGHEAAGG